MDQLIPGTREVGRLDGVELFTWNQGRYQGGRSNHGPDVLGTLVPRSSEPHKWKNEGTLDLFPPNDLLGNKLLTMMPPRSNPAFAAGSLGIPQISIPDSCSSSPLHYRKSGLIDHTVRVMGTTVKALLGPLR